ncbi:MAG: hypothetical protein JRG86_08095 [Deltaproteobacteria bacterium]|jgi:hypothetical protein|nr:hypothetical protein [Deltaproteobacteria bacterium]MBW2501131.1 hypothetical protein [Deltaproteobacteria bacterium]
MSSDFVGGGVVFGLLLAALVVGCAATPAPPKLTGPIEGGQRGRPFATSHIPLGSHDYVEEEFFIAGRARAYAPREGEALGADGIWDVVPGDGKAFRTRILVRRPIEPEHFSGTLIVEWLNVTGGVDIDADWAQTSAEILRRGHAWVGVSAQRAAVNGMEPTELMPVVPPPLTEWDPQRYPDLVIPDDGFSYDIFSQVGRLLASSPRATPDPLVGLQVERVIAMGASQSAHRLATYINAVHPLARVYDGYLIHVRFGRGAPLMANGPRISPLRLRADLDVPVLAVNTESEALAHFAARREDGERYRYWEIAGASHQDAFVSSVVAEQFRRDLGFEMTSCNRPVNTLPARYVMNAALRSLDAWIREGMPPASIARIEISGSPPQIARDESGNARGGLRMPQIAAPVARYGPENSPGACRLMGMTIPFDGEALRRLYSSRADYRSRYEAAARSAIEQGFLLPEDLGPVLDEARRAPFPD